MEIANLAADQKAVIRHCLQLALDQNALRPVAAAIAKYLLEVL